MSSYSEEEQKHDSTREKVVSAKPTQMQAAIIERAKSWAHEELQRDLHPGEVYLLEQVSLGKCANLNSFEGEEGGEIDPERHDEWHVHRNVDSRLIKWIILDDATYKSLGGMEHIDIVGARFEKQIQLGGITSDRTLTLVSCAILGGLYMARARFDTLQLLRCRVESRDEDVDDDAQSPLILYAAVFTGDVLLGGSEFVIDPAKERVAILGSNAEINGSLDFHSMPDKQTKLQGGGLRFDGAVIRKDLSLDGIRIRIQADHLAIGLNNASVGADISISENSTWWPSINGIITMFKVYIGGSFFVIGARIRSKYDKVAMDTISADRSIIKGGVSILPGKRIQTHIFGSVGFRYARIGGGVVIAGSVIAPRNDEEFALDGATIDGGIVAKVNHVNHKTFVCSILSLDDAIVVGDVDFNGVRLRIFTATQMNVRGSVRLSESRITSVVNLRSASVTGDVYASSADCEEVNLCEISVSGNADFSDAMFKGGFAFRNAKIGGNLVLAGAQCSSNGSISIIGDDASVERSIRVCSSSKGPFVSHGSVSLIGVRVSGEINIVGGLFSADNGIAVVLNNAIIGSVASGYPGTRTLLRGALLLRKTTVTGDLNLIALRVRSATTAIDATDAEINGNVRMRANVERPFLAHGTVHFDQSRCGGSFEMHGAFLRPSSGKPAITLTNAKIEEFISLTYSSMPDRMQGFPFDAKGSVNLRHTEIGLNANFHGMRIHNPQAKLENAEFGTSWTALILFHTVIKGALRLGPFPMGRPAGTYTKIYGPIDMRFAQLGRLADFPIDSDHEREGAWRIDHWRGANDSPHNGPAFAIDGLKYDQFGEGIDDDVDRRLAWVGYAQPENTRYTPSSYEQLAEVKRQQGYDGAARKIGYAKQKQRLRHGDLTKLSRTWNIALWLIVGFGYRTERVVVWMFAVWILGVVVFSIGNSTGVMVPTAPEYQRAMYISSESRTLDRNLFFEAAPGYPLYRSTIDSLDRLLPVIDLDHASHWSIQTAAYSGMLVKVYEIFHICSGWFLSTLAIVGLSGLLKSE